MQSSIERIINNDRKAREVVAAAERYRKKSAEDLASKKVQIEKEIKEEISGAADNAKKRFERETVRLAEEKRRNAEKIAQRMDELYLAKKDEWVETYTNRIIKG